MALSTIALAVDGMEQTLLDSWIADGELPNLAAMREEGVFGAAACSSTSSAVQWTTHFTGVGKDRHGVTGFLRENRQRFAGEDAPEARELINLSDIEVLTYPELLSENGTEVGLINPLPLWPPLELDPGFCVSGMLTPPSTDDWVFPTAFREELETLGYRIDVKYGSRPYGFVDDAVFDEVDLSTIRADLFDLLETRIEFSKRVLAEERVGFLYVLLKSIDVFQHCFWAHMEADDPAYGETILEAYRTVDEFVGWIRDTIEANLVVFSDHGFQARRTPRASGVDRFLKQVDNRVPVPNVVRGAYHRLFSTAASVDSPENPGRITGVHKDPAAYLMAGPEVNQAGEHRLAFEDLSPILLALARSPVPDSYVGTVPDGVLSVQPEYEAVDLTTRRRLDLAADEVVGERLHNLGYAEMVDDS